MGASVTKMQQRWELYRLLSDPTRLRLLALASTEELAVSELAELVRQGQPKVSRHATALREAALLSARKQGTWVLLRLTPNAADDPVVADALATGLELCHADGTLERVENVVAGRDADTREFFARGGRALPPSPPTQVGAYQRALAPLNAPRRVASASRPDAPAARRAVASPSQRTTAAANAPASATSTNDPTSVRAAQASAWVCRDGPITVGIPQTPASAGLCPPASTRLPPTKATSPAP